MTDAEAKVPVGLLGMRGMRSRADQLFAAYSERTAARILSHGAHLTMFLLASGGGGLGWAEVAAAALGSSAIGAVVGGIMTTWLRGRIERDEAWRTRMIEAADDLASALSQADLDFNAILIGDVAEARRPLRNPDGTLSKDVARSMKASLDGVRKANRLLTRVELLYGRDSVAYREALSAIYGLSGTVRLLEGNPRAQRAIQAVVANRRGDAKKRDELITRDEVAENRYRALLSEQDLPEDFDSQAGASVATWALKLHDSAVASFRRFMRGAHESSRAKRPGHKGRRR